MIDKNPLVSVLMTAYNREKYIAEAIESVLSSTFCDIELIIVDDCSNDKTVEIAKKYQALDARIKIFVNHKNLGDYPNRNKAASHARGKYLKYLDSDDTMSPICLERMVSEMENHPDCAFGITSRSLENVALHFPIDSFRTHFFERGILDLGPSAVIIRSDIFIKHSGFLELRCVSDFEFWLRLALEYPMIELERDLIFWREHNEQEIKFNTHILQTLEYTLPIIKNKLNSSQLHRFEKEQIIKKYKRNTMRYLIKNVNRIGLSDFLKYKSINQLNFLDAI
jgi:glycosyltransferase involved in cell wall biosynthesis